MSIQLGQEQALPISSAPSEFEKLTGFRPHKSAIQRWIDRGVAKGHRLESFKVGGRRFTTREAIRRFIFVEGSLEVPEPNTEHEAALQRLDNAGI